MSKERELLESAIEYLYDLQSAWLWKENEVAGNGEEYNDLDNLVVKIREHLSQPEQNKPEVISNLDDNTKLISIYKNDVDGHSVIGYAYAYLTLTAFEKLPILLAAQEVIFEELKEAYLELSHSTQHPPKREPLSSIKILELTSKHEYAINLVRAIEKAHGIGGEE